jgi:FixJ family two-component response regulator
VGFVAILAERAMKGAPIVCVVDDDESVRESLTGLLRSIGCIARPFASGEEFLAGYDAAAADCAILDVTMPGMSGVDLQEHLLAAGSDLPVLFITARTEPGLHARLLERGAVACLVKPFNEEDLLAAVRAATGAQWAGDEDEP